MAVAAGSEAGAPNALAPPVWPTPMVGRGAELDRVVERLESVRLVSLVGPGGIGKTRLAAAAAETLRARSGTEVCWVDLIGLTEAEFLVSYVAAALGLREHRGERTLVERLQATDALLVLDNCEHVARACGTLIDRLVRDSGRLRVLATTRTPLGTASESLWRVQPLSVPQCDEDDDAAALQLFALRAADAQPAFTLNAENRPAIARICRRLDGLPLAIELAAARVAVMPPAQLADRLDASLRVLVSRSESMPARHRTLEGVVDWSYALLEAREQALFDRLSVFAGGFTLEAAELVAGDGASDDVLDLLAGLVAHSLVVMTEQQGAARYALLETVREFAAARLQARGPGAVNAVRLRHARFFAGRVDSARSDVAHFRWIEADHDNIRAALSWALSAGEIELALRICAGMREFWARRGIMEPVSMWMTEAVEAARGDPRLDAPRARTLLAAATIARRTGDYVAIPALLDEAESIARRLDDRATLADALTQLGLSARDRGELDLCRSRLTEALELWRATGEVPGLCRALGARASLALAENDTALARALRTEAADLAREAGDADAEAAALIGLGEVARVSGDTVVARACNERSIELFELLGDDWHAAAAYHNLGWIEIEAGRDRVAFDRFSRCVPLFRRSGNPFGLTLCLYGYARLLHRAGNADAAAVVLGAARTHTARAAVRPVAPADVLACEAARLAIEADLPVDAFRRATSRGELRSLPDALEWARERLDRVLGGSTGERSERRAVARTAPSIDRPLTRRDPAPSPEPDLRVRSLGPLSISVRGRALDGVAFGSGRPRELLLLLLVHPDGLTRDRIGIHFWPDASAAQVKNSFHVTLHRLRKALGHPEWIVLDGERYRLDPALEIDFDLPRIEAGLRAALRDDPAGDALARLLGEVRGEFLEDVPAGEWHQPIRDRLRRLHLQALLAHADALAGTGHVGQAIATYEALLARDPLNEPACRGLMSCLARAGRVADAFHFFDRFARLLDAELGVAPAAETLALRDRLLAPSRTEPL